MVDEETLVTPMIGKLRSMIVDYEEFGGDGAGQQMAMHNVHSGVQATVCKAGPWQD